MAEIGIGEAAVDLQTEAWLDQADAYNAERIRRYGWVIQYVTGDTCSAPRCDCMKTGDPAFAYVLNNLGDRIRAGEDVMPGQLITFREWPHRIIAEESPNPGEIVYAANRYYQRPPDDSVPVLQLTYDDREGRFPWDSGYAAPQLQPRPGEFRACP